MPSVASNDLPTLAVCVAYFNPLRYQSRRDNFALFADSAARQGADVWVIEAAEDGQWEVSEDDVRHVIRVSSRDAIWQKERMLNVLIGQLPADYTAVAWVDGDVLFDTHDWVEATRRALAVHRVCQLFENAAWLNQDMQESAWGTGDGRYRSAIATTAARGKFSLRHGHPGFAWAARRQVLTQIGGLYDYHIFGGGDTVMAFGFFGQFAHPYLRQFSGGFRTACEAWMRRAWDVVRGDVAFLPGVLRHLWHGSFANRQYDHRNKISALVDFKPHSHLQQNAVGLWAWTDAAPKRLQDMLKDYFHARREDG